MIFPVRVPVHEKKGVTEVIIKGKDFRLFGGRSERPLCLRLLSEKIAENASEERDATTTLAGKPGEKERDENRPETE